MKYRRLGTGGPEISVIGLGSWLTVGQTLDGRATERLVHEAMGLGINFFDTADIYGEGDAERALGAALRGVPQDDYLIASKCFFPTEATGGEGGLSSRHIARTVENSLSNLRVEKLDLMQCHRFDPDTPLEETVAAFDRLIRDGKVGYWGVSRWTAAQIGAANEICDARGTPRPISNQYFYNMFSRDIEGGMTAEAEREGWGLVVYSPLAQGLLSGKYRPGPALPGSRAANAELRKSMWDFHDDKLRTAAALAELAREHAVGTAQLALAWCLRLPAVRCVMTGATSPQQIRENAGAAGFELTPELAERIEDLLRRT